MKYVVNKIVELINRNLPRFDDEAMIKIDGFEDIRIYENLARELENSFADTKLTVDIKLAKNKWQHFSQDSAMTSTLQSMLQNGWVADESITRYRNLHSSNLLILMGTESEEDKGGLLNCYSITPDTLVQEIYGNFAEVFSYIYGFDELDKAYVNKLYKDLFAHTPVDIVKLSATADKWENSIENINDFIELFYETLPDWGLPIRRNPYYIIKVKSKNNLFELESKFIDRSLFKKMTIKQYTNYEKKLATYKSEDADYGPNSEVWANQAISSYDEFSRIFLEFARGENVEENRKKLIYTDFDIVSTILGIKLAPEKPNKGAVTQLRGEPLPVFTKALIFTLLNILDEDAEEEVANLIVNIEQADIVSAYSNSENTEAKEALVETWKNLCINVNGVISLLNKNTWKLGQSEIDIELADVNVFSPDQALNLIEQGLVKPANSNKTISKIEFSIESYSVDGKSIKDLKQDFCWEFSETNAWLHDFSDIRRISVNGNGSYIPLSSINKIKALIFAKSEEEFFDLYNESYIDFDFNIIEFIQNNSINCIEAYQAGFLELGYAFTEFIETIKHHGFYSSLCKGSDSEVIKLIKKYIDLGELLTKKTLPENLSWILDAYIHAFNLEDSSDSVTNGLDSTCCIVPPWHPATLQKLKDQKIFFLDGCVEWWNEIISNGNGKITRKNDAISVIDNLMQMSMIQSALDIFPSAQQYYSSITSFGAFSIYAKNNIENNNRLKDIIRKDAIFDDDFNPKEMAKMNDNAKMLYGIIRNYVKAFESSNNLSLVFINPVELQPIVASIYKHIEDCKEAKPDNNINITLKILVKPENKGGKNYLAYWMDEFFSQDANVNIKTYLNEWSKDSDLVKFLNGNCDIIFVMDLLIANNLLFIKDSGRNSCEVSQCMFPIVYKPLAISATTVKRKIELSQPQFRAAFTHTQVVRFRNNMEDIPEAKYIAVKEVCIDNNVQNIINSLHNKAYWVVCIDSSMDGALLRDNNKYKDDYSVIGFSTGKGVYGQYNITITARKSIRDSIRKKLSARLYQLFKWSREKVEAAAKICINEAGKLDGISLFSAVNPKDYNINEFMAYILTSLREKKLSGGNALKIMIHLDSYKHWTNNTIEENEDGSNSRPDFLLLEIKNNNKLHIDATIIECKIAKLENEAEHKANAINQVSQGLKRLKAIFNPDSKSIKRRYWYAQLYRALAFAQVTFNNNSQEFHDLSKKLRVILDGEFDISWSGKILGYWVNSNAEAEKVSIRSVTEISEDDGVCEEKIEIVDIPQKLIQSLLLGDSEGIDFVRIDDSILVPEEEQELLINEREKNLTKELRSLQKSKKMSESNPISIENRDELENRVIVNSRPSVVPYSYQKTNSSENLNKEAKISESDSNTNTALDETKSEINAIVSDNFEKILIGKDKFSNPIYWEFCNPQLANRHLLITGTSGQGKTYCIQALLYELSKLDVSSIVFDYTEGFRKDQLEENFLSKMEGKVKEHIVQATGIPINPFKIHEIDLAGTIMPEKPAKVAERISNIFSHVYKFGEQQSGAIFEATRKGIEKYGENMNIVHFKELLEDEKTYNKTAQTVITKMNPFFYGVDFNIDEKFDWSKILYSDEADLNIFQLTGFSRELQVIITELMLWDAWFFTKHAGNKNKPFAVVLDEAQNLSHKKNSPSAMLLTEGRKFGWSAWFATQSLRVLEEEEVTRLLQASTKLCFKPTEDETPKIAKQLDPNSANTLLVPLKNLRKGQCIMVGDRTGLNGKFTSTKPTVTDISSFDERN